ncbi:MAG TPA: hypothetical protein PK020_12945 [Ilumatobacteraceae bacterium]|nr:hypothetical protein [Ilumatobacteraceae bacterium]HRB02898.1 hypothetical protein [Ilumatobacteraceae bacterium]
MRRGLVALGAAGLLLLAGCGDNGDGAISSQPVGTATANTGSTNTAATADTGATTPTVGAGLPAECAMPPVTVVAQRVGSSPIGSDAFVVSDAVALPIPIVPDPDSSIAEADKKSLAAATELLGYSLVFADEPIESGLVLEYEPTAEGKLRGAVSIFPSAGVPLAAGDVVVYGEVSGLSFSLPTVGMDLASFDEDTNMYLDEPSGQVTVVGITDDAMCLDVDLTWAVSDPADNTLTIRGVVAGRLLPRSSLFVLG